MGENTSRNVIIETEVIVQILLLFVVFHCLLYIILSKTKCTPSLTLIRV